MACEESVSNFIVPNSFLVITAIALLKPSTGSMATLATTSKKPNAIIRQPISSEINFTP